jgi:hypothetical protein
VYPLHAGVENATPTQDGAGTGYVSTFNLPTTTAKTIKTFSTETGDNQQVEFGQYGFVETINLSGKPGEAVMINSSFRVRNVDRNQYTGTDIAFASTGSIIYRPGGWANFVAGQAVTASGTALNNNTFVISSISSGSLVTTSAVKPVTEASGSSVVVRQDFKSGISLPAVEEILFSKGTIAIDAVGGSIGATVKSSTWLGFDLSLETGWIPVYTGDGNLYFTFTKSTEPILTCDLTFEYDGTAVAEIENFRAQTARQIRLKWLGAALTTAGTYTYKTFIIDLVGKWQSFSAIDEQDGNDIVTGTFKAAYNSTAGLFGRFIVVNENSSLT